MTQKPRKGDFGELKSQKNSRGSMPQTSVEVGNRSVFILDPRLIRYSKNKHASGITGPQSVVTFFLGLYFLLIYF